MTKEQVQRALRFYETSPDGQYDLDVVVPILKDWLARAAHEPSDLRFSASIKEGDVVTIAGLHGVHDGKYVMRDGKFIQLPENRGASHVE